MYQFQSPSNAMPNCITGLKLFNHLSHDMPQMTRNTTDRYIPNACVCLVNLVRVSHSVVFFFYNPPNLFGGIILLCFSRRWKSRTGDRSCPLPRLARGRAREGIFTIGFYTHCSRFMSRLFLRPLKAKEYDRAAAKQPVDFIACVRFLLRLPHG